MAHSLDLEVIAEGVEENMQKEYLLDSGCDNIQGYLYSKPLSKEDIECYINGSTPCDK